MNSAKRLASAYRVNHALGLFDYAGDVSVRVPGSTTFLIRGARVSTSGSSREGSFDTASEDLIVVDLSCKTLKGDLAQPIETPLHAAIYDANPNIAAVVHAHARMVTAFSIVGRSIEPVYARGLETTGEGIPTFDSAQPISTPELGAALTTRLGSHRACIIRAHGLVTVGPR